MRISKYYRIRLQTRYTAPRNVQYTYIALIPSLLFIICSFHVRVEIFSFFSPEYSAGIVRSFREERTRRRVTIDSTPKHFNGSGPLLNNSGRCVDMPLLRFLLCFNSRGKFRLYILYIYSPAVDRKSGARALASLSCGFLIIILSRRIELELKYIQCWFFCMNFFGEMIFPSALIL